MLGLRKKLAAPPVLAAEPPAVEQMMAVHRLTVCRGCAACPIVGLRYRGLRSGYGPGVVSLCSACVDGPLGDSLRSAHGPFKILARPLSADELRSEMREGEDGRDLFHELLCGDEVVLFRILCQLMGRDLAALEGTCQLFRAKATLVRGGRSVVEHAAWTAVARRVTPSVPRTPHSWTRLLDCMLSRPNLILRYVSAPMSTPREPGRRANSLLDGDADTRSPRLWSQDAEHRECEGCDQLFSPVVRRHHCRGCGKVLCSQCAPESTVRLCPGCHTSLCSAKAGGAGRPGGGRDADTGADAHLDVHAARANGSTGVTGGTAEPTEVVSFFSSDGKLGIVFGDEWPRIKRINEGSLAELQPQIQVGMELLAINVHNSIMDVERQSMEGWDFDRFFTTFGLGKNRPLELVFRKISEAEAAKAEAEAAVDRGRFCLHPFGRTGAAIQRTAYVPYRKWVALEAAAGRPDDGSRHAGADDTVVDCLGQWVVAVAIEGSGYRLGAAAAAVGHSTLVKWRTRGRPMATVSVDSSNSEQLHIRLASSEQHYTRAGAEREFIYYSLELTSLATEYDDDSQGECWMLDVKLPPQAGTEGGRFLCIGPEPEILRRGAEQTRVRVPVGTSAIVWCGDMLLLPRPSTVEALPEPEPEPGPELEPEPEPEPELEPAATKAAAVETPAEPEPSGDLERLGDPFERVQLEQEMAVTAPEEEEEEEPEPGPPLTPQRIARPELPHEDQTAEAGSSSARLADQRRLRGLAGQPDEPVLWGMLFDCCWNGAGFVPGDHWHDGYPTEEQLGTRGPFISQGALEPRSDSERAIDASAPNKPQHR